MTKETYFHLKEDYEKIYGKESPVPDSLGARGFFGKLAGLAVLVSLVATGYYIYTSLGESGTSPTVKTSMSESVLSSLSGTGIALEEGKENTFRESGHGNVRMGVCEERWKNGARDADTAYCLARGYYDRKEYAKALRFAEMASVKNPSKVTFDFYLKVLSRVDPKKAKRMREKYGE